MPDPKTAKEAPSTWQGVRQAGGETPTKGAAALAVASQEGPRWTPHLPKHASSVRWEGARRAAAPGRAGTELQKERPSKNSPKASPKPHFYSGTLSLTLPLPSSAIAIAAPPLSRSPPPSVASSSPCARTGGLLPALRSRRFTFTPHPGRHAAIRRKSHALPRHRAFISLYLHVMMESIGGEKSKKSSVQYESPLGYVIEDVRPHGGSEKFRTAAYSNCVRKPS